MIILLPPQPRMFKHLARVQEKLPRANYEGQGPSRTTRVKAVVPDPTKPTGVRVELWRQRAGTWEQARRVQKEILNLRYSVVRRIPLLDLAKVDQAYRETRRQRNTAFLEVPYQGEQAAKMTQRLGEKPARHLMAVGLWTEEMEDLLRSVPLAEETPLRELWNARRLATGIPFEELGATPRTNTTEKPRPSTTPVLQPTSAPAPALSGAFPAGESMETEDADPPTAPLFFSTFEAVVPTGEAKAGPWLRGTASRRRGITRRVAAPRGYPDKEE